MMVLDWYRAKNKDKVVLVEKSGEEDEDGEGAVSYRITSVDFVDTGANKYRRDGEVYTLKKGIINRHKKYTYYLDKDSGEFLSFDSSDKVLEPKEEDLMINSGLLGGVVKGFMAERDRDKLILIMTLLAGLGIGFIVSFITFLYMAP